MPADEKHLEKLQILGIKYYFVQTQVDLTC